MKNYEDRQETRSHVPHVWSFLNLNLSHGSHLVALLHQGRASELVGLDPYGTPDICTGTWS